MAPGQFLGVSLPAAPESFIGWIAHAEVGGGADGSQVAGGGAGEHGAGRAASDEHGARAVGGHDTGSERRAAARAGQDRLLVRSSLLAQHDDPPWAQKAKGRGDLSGGHVRNC